MAASFDILSQGRALVHTGKLKPSKIITKLAGKLKKVAETITVKRIRKTSYTRESTMRVCKTLKPDREFDITRPNNVLNLEILTTKK